MGHEEVKIPPQNIEAEKICSWRNDDRRRGYWSRRRDSR